MRPLALAVRDAVARPGLPFDLAVSLLLALVTLASRWPYRARMLYNWDAVQFALALREFDIAKHQPHPPGYVLYVGLGRLLNATLADPTLAYVTLAMIFSAASAVTVYWLARALYDRTTAVAAAALLAMSPLFWFYGSVGLTYAGEAFGATLMALLAYRTLEGRVAHLYMGAVCLGLVGGLRPSVLLLLLPLWAGSAWLGIRERKRLVAAGALLAAAVLVWFLPLVWLAGGWRAYLRASSELYGMMVLPTSVVSGHPEATFRQARYVVESILVGLGPLALALAALPLLARRGGWTRREWFLLGWIAPPVAVYTLVHFGQAGYVLTFLPALVILLSHAMVEGVTAGSRWLRRPQWRWALTLAALGPLLLINTGFFVSARPAPREFDRRAGDAWLWLAKNEAHDWILSRTASALREHEAVLRTYVETIRAVYDPQDTAVLTELGNPRSYPWLRHAMFYMPEYAIYQLYLRADPPGFYASQAGTPMVPTPGTRITVPRRIRQLVWFVDHWDPDMPRPRGLLEIRLSYGRFLYVLPLGNRPVEHAGYTFVRG
ncbi:MAG TPA: DUF2723 domain-containing protein [Methylomirabilota bacterium]|nr:DUF2723 domain-containing protein [Methylomirabilota bacterium]